jgi:ribosome-associated toxin RatA of RatAB toxin-antitoxin module
VPRIFVLALRPALQRALGVGGVGPDEVQAPARRAAVGDAHHQARAALAGVAKLDAQELAVVGEALRGLAVDQHLVDLHVDRVQLDRAQVVPAHAQPQARAPGQTFARQIEIDLEPYVLERDRTIGRVVRPGACGNEGFRHRAHHPTASPRERQALVYAAGVSESPAPVRREHFMRDATPAEVYAVVVDFPAYPRLFPDFASTKVLAPAAGDGKRLHVEFRMQKVVPIRYVLAVLCDPQALTVEWTYVEGEVVTGSEGGWRFTADGQGTRVAYRASLTIKAPLPGFVIRKVTDALVSASLPAMFASIEREVAARRPK